MPVSSRDNRIPMELLTGVAPKTVIKHIVLLGVGAIRAADISDEELRAPLAGIHPRGHVRPLVKSSRIASETCCLEPETAKARGSTAHKRR